jgi:hypothetical protein
MDTISCKILRFLGILNRLKKFLPRHILRTLYFSMVNPHFIYAMLAWGFDMSRLHKLQKRAIRIITCSKYNAHTEPLFKLLNILKLDDVFKINVLKFYFKYTHGELPHYFNSFGFTLQRQIHNHNTRNRNLLTLNPIRTLQASKCLRNYIPSFINSLPVEISSKFHTHSFLGFSNYCKKFYLGQYSYECSILHCYICNRQ